MAIEIPLSKRGIKSGLHVAIIDDEDEILAGLNWIARESKKSNTIYVYRRADARGGNHLHKMVLERMLGHSLEEGELVDHIDGNGLNNQRHNLRRANSKNNAANRKKRKGTTSKYKGVSFHKKDMKYHARIMLNGVNYYLGRYDTEEEAYEAYCKKGQELHGEFFNPG